MEQIAGTFSLQALLPRISWEHFFHTWNVKPGTAEATQLQREATELLQAQAGNISVRYLLQPFSAKSEGDDIVLLSDKTIRLPFLRQQRPDSDGLCWSIADFVSDTEQQTIFIFATTATVPCSAATSDSEADANGSTISTTNADPYLSLLSTTLADRLAEAAAETLQAQLEAEDQQNSKAKSALSLSAPSTSVPSTSVPFSAIPWPSFPSFPWPSPSRIIRPAVGYPSIPDMSMNFLLNALCDFTRIGIRLTDSGMMQPHSSVSGLIIAHPRAHYFSIGPVGDDQLLDYALRRNMSPDELRRFIN